MTKNVSGVTKSSPQPINGVVQNTVQVGPLNPIDFMSIDGVVNVQTCDDACRESKIVVVGKGYDCILETTTLK